MTLDAVVFYVLAAIAVLSGIQVVVNRTRHRWSAEATRQGRSRMTAIVSLICKRVIAPTLPLVATIRWGETARSC